MKHVPWEKPPEPKLVLHGDWGWFLETKNKSHFQFVKYTWRHWIRLKIGLDGKVGHEWTFKRIKFRGKLHYFLNWIL